MSSSGSSTSGNLRGSRKRSLEDAITSQQGGAENDDGDSSRRTLAGIVSTGRLPEEDDDDDQVEFLYCIPAAATTITRLEPTEDQQQPTMHQSQAVSPVPNGKATTAAAILSANNALDQPFPHRSSAYLQCLAEICYTILWDERWRVKRQQQEQQQSQQSQRLFAWERGEDMTAIHTLSRRYLKPTEQTTSSNDAHNNPVSDNHNNNHDDADDDDYMLDRCLETYCRMYFRKGPWFRLDDIYTRYYRPKKKSNNYHQQKQAELSETTTAGSTSNVHEADRTKPRSPSKFFLPSYHQRSTTEHRSNGTRKNSSRNSSNGGGSKISTTDRYIDQGSIDIHLEAVQCMLFDIERLLSMGLIRSFHGEEECGKVIGNPTTTGRYTNMAPLLRQDEQRSILTMLGGGGGEQKRKNPSSTTTRASSTKTDRYGKTSSSTSNHLPENLIWKQMCRQQAIFQNFTKTNTSTSTRHCLPVAKHVHRLLVEKWARTIILEASKVEYIPSSVFRSAASAVCDKLMGLTTAFSYNIFKNGHVSTIMCIRMREAPLTTLQRACRLYLCATSGPGDMRGDGTNAWVSLPSNTVMDCRQGPVRTNIAAPPGSQSWHTISYPGKDWRMRLRGCNFVRSYTPIVVDGSTDKQRLDLSDDSIPVFSSVQAFHSWELAVELRATVDYLLELNELVLYNQRKEARQREKGGKVESQSEDDGNESMSESDGDSNSEGSHVDFLGLLTISGRANLIRVFSHNSKQDYDILVQKIEQEVAALLGTPLGERPLSALSEMSRSDLDLPKGSDICCLKNEYEKILGVVAIILIHLLESRNNSASRHEVELICRRPWLRHLCWEGCLAYLLWDTIPVLERRGYYDIAIDSLEILIFGTRLKKGIDLLPCSLVTTAENKGNLILSSTYLSRRARGKAYERLIIDYVHKLKQERAESPIVQKTSDGPEQKKKKNNMPTPNELVNRLIEPLLQSHALSGRISFSAARTLARRLKRPLSQTLKGLQLFEVTQLGHRLDNGPKSETNTSKYTDWTPVTDTAVANSIVSDNNGVGGRCAFVGFEEDEDISIQPRSLNVEELAKEFYSLGRLPESNTSSSTWAKGGWAGYHDEGGKIRSLFRILSSATLGMDWTHSNNNEPLIRTDLATIHLTPYQGAPFDLHVGAEMADAITRGHVAGEYKAGGIYARRKAAIDEFLKHLASLSAQEISDLVYDNINNRLNYLNSIHHVDPTVESDLDQVRTLSMLAAGFGGKMLSAIFRCLFFDYRHYSGGLPDLLLTRAIYCNTEELVDLGEWVGEAFSSKYQAALKADQAVQILVDKDDEFLGCSKVGDSGGRTSNRFDRRSFQRRVFSPVSNTDEASTSVSQPKILKMPERLRLEHNAQKIRVECMCVEVKSQNDRLDPRQEDWLNILDRYGNARVCKFVKTKSDINATKGRMKGATNARRIQQIPRSS